jgi:hypothetical protein
MPPPPPPPATTNTSTCVTLAGQVQVVEVAVVNGVTTVVVMVGREAATPDVKVK